MTSPSQGQEKIYLRSRCIYGVGTWTVVSPPSCGVGLEGFGPSVLLVSAFLADWIRNEIARGWCAILMATKDEDG
jgi:hypothetical protein